MRKWFFLALAIVALTACAGQAAAAQPALKIEARSAVLMEASTGEILISQNADQPLPPASVTKIMTMILIMEEIEKGRLALNEKITVSSEAARMGGSQIWLEPGEEMSVADLLKAISIVSANDACYALAERIAGSADAFVRMMNERVRSLGLKSTTFVNCTGLSPDNPGSPGNITSAMDIAVMSRELLKHPIILQWTSTWIDHIRGGQSFLRNTNKLVRFYTGCDGLKTGFTNEAGFCLSATAIRNNVRLIAVVMNAATGDIRSREISRMLNYGFGLFQAVPAIRRGEVVSNPPVSRGDPETVRVVADTDVFVTARRGTTPKFTRLLKLDSGIAAPIRKGQKLGAIQIRIGDQMVGESHLIAAEPVKRVSFGGMLGQVVKNLFEKLFGR